MSIASLSTGISGMKAYQRALDSSANNIANVQTGGYQAQVPRFQENENGGVRVEISQESRALAAQDYPNTDINTVDLATELTNNIQFKAGFELSAKLVKATDEILSSLLDLGK